MRLQMTYHSSLHYYQYITVECDIGNVHYVQSCFKLRHSNSTVDGLSDQTDHGVVM